MATQLISFVDDGFTHETSVYFRGQHVEVDLEKFPHFNLGPDEQVQKFGRPYFQKGPWHGALYDTGDPTLTREEKARLEDANKEIVAAREAEAKKSNTEAVDTSKRGRTTTATK